MTYAAPHVLTQHPSHITGPAATVAERTILLAGPFRSGSTWTFNCLQELAVAAGVPFTACFANEITPEVETLFASGGLVIVKTHFPSEALLARVKARNLVLIVTARDPRDCVTSLMLQFRYNFSDALADVRRSCLATRLLARAAGLVLRYEDGFPRDPETVARLAAAVGLRVGHEQRLRIFAALRPEAVRAKINSYVQEGVFDGAAPALQFHAQTHWHPNHVGDGQVRKYKRNLSFREACRTTLANLRYCWMFAYWVPV